MNALRQRHLVVAVALGVATTVAYMIGSGRVFGYDAAVTFANFIATPSLWDAFAVHSALPSISIAVIAPNDHVLLSFLSHMFYSLTGSRSEAVYRFLPALAGGATVAVTTAALAPRFGVLAAASAGMFIATDPMFVENSRDVRGYSLAALCAVVATLLLIGKRTRRRLFAYAVVLALGMASHIFVAVVVVGHFLYVLITDRPALMRLVPVWVAGVALGLAINGNVLYLDLTGHGLPPRFFRPDFGELVLLFVLGAPIELSVGLWLSTVLLGMWTLRSEAWFWGVLGGFAAIVALFWLVLQPGYLFPRFFIFLIPATAYVVAVAIQRWKVVLAPVVLVGAAAAIWGQIPDYVTDPLALRQAAAVIDQAEAGGQQVCVIHMDEQVLAAYTRGFKVVTSTGQLGGCDMVVVASWNVDLSVRDEANKEFPAARALPAYYPTVVLTR